jgi:hypothetical protein
LQKYRIWSSTFPRKFSALAPIEIFFNPTGIFIQPMSLKE